jgi:transketolase
MNNLKLNKNQKLLRKRIIDISYKNKLSHIGSCLNSVDLIDGVYAVKKKNDVFILSSGHSAVAWYAVLEKYSKKIIYDKIECIHPDRILDKNISVSTGSLGQGLPIAVGIALAKPENEVFCLISDGESAEGSVWESLRIISDKKIKNIKVILTANGYGAYDPIDTELLKKRISGFGLKMIEIDGHNPKEINKALSIKTEVPVLLFAHTSSEQLPFLNGLNAHYYVMSDDLSVADTVLS